MVSAYVLVHLPTTGSSLLPACRVVYAMSDVFGVAQVSGERLCRNLGTWVVLALLVKP